jgi:hypothetical protein
MCFDLLKLCYKVHLINLISCNPYVLCKPSPCTNNSYAENYKNPPQLRAARVSKKRHLSKRPSRPVRWIDLFFLSPSPVRLSRRRRTSAAVARPPPDARTPPPTCRPGTTERAAAKTVCSLSSPMGPI